MWVVVLYRKNRRFVKQSRPFRAKYAAKQLKKAWEDKYDQTYTIEIEMGVTNDAENDA